MAVKDLNPNRVVLNCPLAIEVPGWGAGFWPCLYPPYPPCRYDCPAAHPDQKLKEINIGGTRGRK